MLQAGECAMTQIVTVSAHTAAYAMEAVKPPTKLPSKKHVEETVRIAKARESDSVTDPILAVTDAVKSMSAGLASLNSGARQPQASIKEAIDAYRRTSDL